MNQELIALREALARLREVGMIVQSPVDPELWWDVTPEGVADLIGILDDWQTRSEHVGGARSVRADTDTPTQ